MEVTVATLTLSTPIYILDAGEVKTLYPAYIREYRRMEDSGVPEGVKAEVTVRPTWVAGKLGGTDLYYYSFSGELNGSVLYSHKSSSIESKLYLTEEGVRQAQKEFRQRMYEDAQRELTAAAKKVAAFYQKTLEPLFGEDESNG